MRSRLTRRKYLAAVGAAIGIAGCNEQQGGTGSPAPSTEVAPDTTEGTLVVPSEDTTTVSPTPTSTPTSTWTPTETTSTATTTSEPTTTESENSGGSGGYSGGDGGGGGGGSDPTPTPTPTPTSTPSSEFVIEDGETESSSSDFYESIVWEATGRLVIEDGAGLGLIDQND